MVWLYSSKPRALDKEMQSSNAHNISIVVIFLCYGNSLV